MFNNAITPCLAVIYYIGTYYYMQALLIYSIYYTQLGLPAYQKSRASFHWIIIRFITSIFGNRLDSVVNILRIVLFFTERLSRRLSANFGASDFVVIVIIKHTILSMFMRFLSTSMWFRLCCIICRVLLMSLHTLEIIFSCCYN